MMSVLPAIVKHTGVGASFRARRPLPSVRVRTTVLGGESCLRNGGSIEGLLTCTCYIVLLPKQRRAQQMAEGYMHMTALIT